MEDIKFGVKHGVRLNWAQSWWKVYFCVFKNFQRLKCIREFLTLRSSLTNSNNYQNYCWISPLPFALAHSHISHWDFYKATLRAFILNNGECIPMQNLKVFSRSICRSVCKNNNQMYTCWRNQLLFI